MQQRNNGDRQEEIPNFAALMEVEQPDNSYRDSIIA